ncbi:sensor histidine kinase [Halobaculum marinum]|uniref:histidine kinase n=1 Tax=Halobaculum marinum TaxID=3031996 RepID=A0ABD5WU34_9EURY|nr:PAS domain-containing sensor histidine kinase [Halobaculum sp. DT55]
MSLTESDLYREAFRETDSPAVIADTNLVITDVNEAAREFTGSSRGALIGSTPRRLVDDDAVYAEIEETLLAGDAWVGEFESTATDGRVVYGRGSFSPLTAGGEVRGYIAVFTDMTRHRRYEESLRILNRVLRHNLRNDANVVLGHIERVADEVVDRVDAQEVSRLLDSLDTAADRVDDMLDHARTTRRFSGVLAGEHGTLRPIDLATAIEDAVADVPTDGVRITDDVSQPTPVLADEMLAGALHAVIENAVEHNDKEHVEITLSTTEHADQTVLSVADNGPGVDPDRYAEIFGNGEHTQVEHGEGLSLFFVDRLMELYGGDVSVRSNDPEGAVFDLHFRRPGADPTVPPREFSTADGADAASSRGDVARRTDAEGDVTDDGTADACQPPTDGVVSNRAGRAGEGHADSRRDGFGRAGSSAAANDLPIEYAEGGTDADEESAPTLVDTVADAVGDSVTAPRLGGTERGFPPVVDALPEYDQPHHLLALRAADPVAGDTDAGFRGEAAAAFTDTAVVVVVDGDHGGRLTVPYDSLTAVGRRGDAVVLDAGATAYRLQLPRAHDDDAAVEAAVAFLERELR